MKRFLSLSVFMFFVTSPATVLADETGFFAGLDVLGGIAGGSSDTTNGGAPFAGGGVVRGSPRPYQLFSAISISGAT